MSFLGTLGSVVDVATSIADPILDFIGLKETNKTNKKINEQNVNAQKELQERNLAYQTQMYERALADNSPTSMVKAYEKAGLNPYMMMQDGTWNTISQPSGSAASVPSSIPMQAPSFDLSGIGSSLDRLFNNRYKEEEIEALSYQNDHKSLKMLFDIEERIADIKHKENINSQDAQTLRVLEKEADFLEKTLNARVSQQKSDSDMAALRFDDAQFEYNYKVITENLRYAILERQAEGEKLNNQQKKWLIKQASAQVSQILQEIQNLKAQKKLTEVQEKQALQALRTGRPDEIASLAKASWMTKELKSKMGYLRYVLRWESDEFSPTITNLSPFKFFK